MDDGMLCGDGPLACSFISCEALLLWAQSLWPTGVLQEGGQAGDWRFQPKKTLS
jgi:hypothetical protein